MSGSTVVYPTANPDFLQSELRICPAAVHTMCTMMQLQKGYLCGMQAVNTAVLFYTVVIQNDVLRYDVHKLWLNVRRPEYFSN